MPARHKDEERVFKAAVKLGSPAERATYLKEVCGDDAGLLNRVQALLTAFEEAGNFLEAPALALDISVATSPVSEVPGTVIGRYKLLEKIGEGGMAVVYVAEQQEPIRRKVALKIIKLGMDTRQVIARFEAERQALALMDHPSIAKVLDAGATETGRPYFVMELVQGVSITEYCDQNKLNTKERLDLFVQVCHAVQHAHQKGIIHRDIKPSNVMVTHHDGKPVPKVIDFGIAKATNQKLTEKTLFTRYAHLIGTPAYMSPEQAELSDLDIDTRSDIYSLGVLLYELLTGTTPFSEEELRKAGYIEMQRIIREQEPVKPSTKLSTLGETLADIANHRSCSPDLLRKAVRGDLDWIVMKALEKDRVRRYETASSFAEDLRRHLQHEPVLARGPSRTYHLRKLLRRNRTQVVAVLVFGVLIAVVIALVSTWNRDRLQLVEAEGFRHRGILSEAREQYAKADREAALETAKSVLYSRHVGVEAQLLYANILVDGRRSDEAMILLRKLLNERPAIAGATHSLLARVLWESGSPDAEKLREIEEHRRQAAALLSETAEAYFLQAMTTLAVKEQLAWLDKALELEPGHYEARRLRAFIYYASRKYEKMKDDALGMIIMKPREPLGYSLRAIAWRELGRYQEAMADYDRAIARTDGKDPQYINLSAQRCETLLRMGSYERAVTDAQVCLTLWPESSIFQYYTFCALTALGDYEKAGVQFRQIAQLTPTARDEFQDWLAKYVFDTLGAGRSWHPPNREPSAAAFLPMVEAEESYRDLSAKARRVTTDGFMGHCSPDGKKIAFSAGYYGYSGIAVHDRQTGETDLLFVPGRDPAWSPDGRHIAFSRDSVGLPVPELAHAERAHRRAHSPQNEEIWLMNADGTEPRRLASGSWASWGHDSRHVYYHSWNDGALCSLSIEAVVAKPQPVLACGRFNPVLSPDQKYAAYENDSKGPGLLTLVDLSSQTVISEWQAPFPVRGVFWAPKTREICLGTWGPVGPGLWIHDLDTKQVRRVLMGPIHAASNRTAHDRTLVFDLKTPYYEIWAVDLDPNVPILESLGPGKTLEEIYQDMVAFYTRRIEADPQDAQAYFGRAQYYEYLHDREKAEADMERFSAILSPRPSPALRFGAPVKVGSVIPVFDSVFDRVSCFSPDGLEMYIASNRAGGYGAHDLWVLRRASADGDWGPPENLGPAVNSPQYDGDPAISADGLTLYYNSARAGGFGGNDIYRTTRANRYDLWGPPVNLGPTVNSASNDTASWISPDGRELYLMSWLQGHGYGLGDMYVARRAEENDPWGAPVNLGPVVNCGASENCPSLSPDGLLLLFCDDGAVHRPSGYGNADLWMARRATLSDPWQAPVNLGPTVNGRSYERWPYIAPDGRTLYFRSNRGGTLESWQAPISPTVDFNGDGTVDAKDQVELQEHLGTSDLRYDIGPMPWGDGKVDSEDLKVFISYREQENATNAGDHC